MGTRKLWGRRCFYIGIETKARELDAKILLACAAAEAGFAALVGNKGDLMRLAGLLPPGVFLDKSAAVTKIDAFNELHAGGHRVMVNDEEGFVILDADIYLRQRVSRQALAMTDAFCAWGPYQAAAVASLAQHSQRVIQTGNPRLDLLRSEFRDYCSDRVAELRSKYGPFILVNTRFGSCNHFDGPDGWLRRLRRAGLIRSAEDEEQRRAYLGFNQELFTLFVGAVKSLGARFTDRKVIVRPHPSESHDRWVHEVAHLPNVEVVHDGNVVPWLIAAAATIHNGCTTGVEGFLLGKQVIAYRPITSEASEPRLPNSVSIQARSQESLMTAVEAAIRGDVPDYAPENPWCTLDEYLVGHTGPLASERIVDIAASLTHVPGLREILLSTFRFRSFSVWSALRNRIATMGRFVAGEVQSTRSEYSRQKFPGLERQELVHIVANLSRVSGRFRHVSVAPVYRSCYVLTSDPRAIEESSRSATLESVRRRCASNATAV